MEERIVCIKAKGAVAWPGGVQGAEKMKSEMETEPQTRRVACLWLWGASTLERSLTLSGFWGCGYCRGACLWLKIGFVAGSHDNSGRKPWPCENHSMVFRLKGSWVHSGLSRKASWTLGAPAVGGPDSVFWKDRSFGGLAVCTLPDAESLPLRSWVCRAAASLKGCLELHSGQRGFGVVLARQGLLGSNCEAGNVVAVIF